MSISYKPVYQPGMMSTLDTMLVATDNCGDYLRVGNTTVEYLLKLLGMRDNLVGQLIPLLKLWCGTT